MTKLGQERCVACRRDSPLVTDDEIAELRPVVSQWSLIEDGAVKKLRRQFRFSNFQRALDFSMTIGRLAEEEGHHPRLVTEWGGVTIDWWTHKIRGLHRNDFIMAAKTDQNFAAVDG